MKQCDKNTLAQAKTIGRWYGTTLVLEQEPTVVMDQFLINTDPSGTAFRVTKHAEMEDNS
jgi:hypothetical protein